MLEGNWGDFMLPLPLRPAGLEGPAKKEEREEANRFQENAPMAQHRKT